MRFISGDRIFDGKQFLPEARVLVYNAENVLLDIVSPKSIDPLNIEHHEGILMPGFVNAHCHLELSHLKNLIEKHTGLPGFAKQVISQRNNFSPEAITESAKVADKELWENGIVAVGDISNTTSSFEIKKSSPVYYHTFIELLGLNPARLEKIVEEGFSLLEILKENNLSGSLAPHAPYSTSLELIKSISDYNRKHGLVFSMHSQESEEEELFLMGNEKSKFYDLYRFLNLDVSWFVPPKKSGLAYYSQLLPPGKTILVHNTFTKKQDFEYIKNKETFFCFCPNANLYIENKLPDYNLFSEYKNHICLGTDSLASNTQLNLVEEANQILKNTDVLNMEDILRALSYNGARVLAIENSFGSLLLNKNAGLNHIKIKEKKIEFVKKVL